MPSIPAVLTCGAIALAPVAGYAASRAVELHGLVVDPAQAAVPNADVIVIRLGKTVAHIQTDAQGQFAFNAAPASYQVIIAAYGFSRLRSTPVPFSRDGRTQFALQVESTGSGSSLGAGADVTQASLPALSTATATPGEHANPATVLGSRPWEFGVLAQGGFGTEDRSDFRFFSLGGHAGKVLTSNVGSGLLQGNFEYSVEVFPLWQSYTPRFQRVSCTETLGSSGVVTSASCSTPYSVGGTFTGVSITPIQLRWNLTHGERWTPWLQGAGGVVWTNHKYPAIGNTNTADLASNGPSGDTSVWNFTPQFGIGTHYFLAPRRSLDFSANAVHISSASLGDKNPGVNASVQFTLGYTWWR